MTTERDKLLARIEKFLARTKMGPTWFGQASCRCSHLVERLRNGGDVSTATAAKISEFLDSRQNDR